MKNLEEFLERIEASKILQEQEGLAKLTDAIIENLPAGETYPFFVWPKLPAYPMPDAQNVRMDQKTRQKLIKKREKYIRQHTKRLREYFEDKNIPYPDVKIIRVFPVELTSEQVRELKSYDYVKKITPGIFNYTLA